MPTFFSQHASSEQIGVDGSRRQSWSSDKIQKASSQKGAFSVPFALYLLTASCGILTVLFQVKHDTHTERDFPLDV